MATVVGKAIPSFAFSGAGFLTCYHLGAASCLQRQGLLLGRDESPAGDTPLLSGVSGGALVATAVALGVDPEDGMNATMAIARRARIEGGLLDHLQPGFSLVDCVEKVLLALTTDIDEDYVWHRTDHGKLLRIGLTDGTLFPRFRRNPQSYLYVDEYESIDEIISACILSSYIPGLTGPVLAQTKHGAARRANMHLSHMMDRGSVKNSSGVPISNLSNPSPIDNVTSSMFWDGGLANVFPVVDSDTCLVTPFVGHFGIRSISPDAESGGMPMVQVSDHAQLLLSLENVKTIRRIAFSSGDQVLESWYEQGFNDALRFVDNNSLTTEYSVYVGESHSAAA